MFMIMSELWYSDEKSFHSCIIPFDLQSPQESAKMENAL